MALTIYFLRHGQTPYSKANCFCGAGLDPELTPEGHEMAESFAAAYKDTKWQAIYTSTLKRTAQTAEPLCKAVGLTPIQRDDIKEIAYGEWEGQTIEKVKGEYHDDYIRWTADPGWNPPTGGEAAVTIARRSLRVIEEIHENYSDGNVLVVSHKATIRIMLCGFLGFDPGRFRYRLDCPVGSISVVQFNSTGPFVKLLADRTHLSDRLKNLEGT